MSSSIFEFILVGLGSIIGYNMLLITILLISFVILLISRGAGVTSLIGTVMLGVYLFSSNKIGGTFLMISSYEVLFFVVIGLFMGWAIYEIFFKNN